VHICSKVAASSQTPSQRRHSSIVTLPTVTCDSSPLHAGQGVAEPSVSTRPRAAPHFGQNAVPSNIGAKHDAQVTAASRARQYSHRRASGSAAAPQFGQ
jgi:hypothetical protein